MMFVSYVYVDSEDRNCFGNAIVHAVPIESEKDIREIEHALNITPFSESRRCTILNWKVL